MGLNLKKKWKSSEIFFVLLLILAKHEMNSAKSSSGLVSSLILAFQNILKLFTKRFIITQIGSDNFLLKALLLV